MKLICKTVFGSHLYGTSTPTSDVDVRGVFLPSKKDILLGRIPKTNKEQGDATDDFELYSLHHFVKLACEGQTVAFDMLWTPASQTTLGEAGHVWESIVALRQKFLSKRMNAFIGYARGQAAKYSLKGERLSKLERFLDGLTSVSEDANLEEVMHLLPRDDARINQQGVAEIQIAGKWFGARTQVKYIKEAVENTVKKYGKRANAASEADGVDWKAMSHAVRVSLEMQELLTAGEIQFPLRYAEGLLRIKKGQHDLVFVQDYLDEVLENVEALASKSNLPEQVDREFWDDWLCTTISQTME